MGTPPSFSPFQGLFIDIESVPGGEIFALGATCGETFRHEATGRQAVAELIAELRRRAPSAAFIAGHNILAHDLPALEAAFQIPELLALPAIDTLHVSPLAFPRNPYHRLTKNDRLTSSSKNHPLRDCDSSRTILNDAVAVFRSWLEDPAAVAARERLALTRWLIARAELPRGGSRGFELLFSSVGVPSLDATEAAAAWTRQTGALTCRVAARSEWHKALVDPTHAAALAYVLAWLPVAGADSVVPGWVRHRFPSTAAAIRNLRNAPCGESTCSWCSETQSPVRQLQRFFDYPAFRSEPAVAGRPGVSLQEEIVRLAMAGTSVLAILPTGGGKSLCFQVPALHRFFTTGAITIVVTPLQALMKDQVEGLIERTSLSCVAALNGLQTPPEKAEVREAVRLGSIGILYVSPEQLRNRSFKNAILQREIGGWVFDEAHCLSQWGHDFRPDYVYITRFIRELAALQQAPVPPVMCVTATAKDDVKNEILAHFRERLGHELVLLDGGTARQNLSYRIEKVGEPEKPVRIHGLLTEAIGSGVGAAVVFAATRQRAQDLAEFLAGPPRSWACAAFHAGLAAEQKKEILDGYLGGRLQVVVATNAFGMGIDKPDIRLVVHADTPGSLENYLQEAGRAGRDRAPAECVLLYNPEDLETQFGLLAMAKIEKRDIDQIWRAILRADSGDGKPVTLTVSEILDDPREAVSFVEEAEERRGTKVRTALAVLEKQGFLERDENLTRVFQARALVADEREALARMERLDLPENTRRLWIDVINLLLTQNGEAPASIDDFAELPRMRERYAQMRAASYDRVSPYAPVFQVLNEMARPEVGLISKDVLFSARLRVGRTGHAGHLLAKVAARERDLIEALRDEEPNPEGWVPLAVRRVNQLLVDKGHRSLPEDVLRILRTLATDGRKMGRLCSMLELGYQRSDHLSVRVSAPWNEVLELSALRNAAAAVLVDFLRSKAKAADVDSALVLVEFGESEIVEAFRADLTLNLAVVRDLTAFIQYLLVYLHDSDLIELKNGKALISQAMSMRVLEKRRGRQTRRFTKGDYAALLVHYSEKVFQIHVMGEYARIGLARLSAHLRLISAYFEMGKAAFAAQFLREKPEVYTRATGIDSFRKIVDDLRNPVQQAIVAEPASANMLVLAGPGSGKTRVVAHRCAFLLRVERIRPERILVACFNRHAALQLRRQIWRLVGKDAHGVMIQTYHGLALRLLGRSPGGSAGADELPDFDQMLDEAIALLTGAQRTEGVRSEDLRDRILAGFSHILVDEYQDIDEREYAFISAIAGRRETDEDRKLAILAVGDDDQSIYGFKGANVGFIRRFQQDYQAREHYLTENYRSTGAIIAAANQLIARNTDRMKVAHPIRVNRARAGNPSGGRGEALDPVARGKVQRVLVADALHQAEFIVDEIQRLRSLGDGSEFPNFAVLARTREDLVAIRAALEAREIPVDWRAEGEVKLSLFHIREIHAWLACLETEKHATWTASDVRERLRKLRGRGVANRWWRLLDEIRSEWAGEAGDADVPVAVIRDFFAEALAERKRDQRTADGVVLTTVHKAKGLEFAHVFIADGGWSVPAEPGAMEEERRVYYVAATRAQETLAVLVRKDRRTPFPGEMGSDAVVDRMTRPTDARTGLSAAAKRSYAITDPTELYISYAGRLPSTSLVHAAIRATSTGDAVHLVSRGNWIQIETSRGVPIGALSDAGKKLWQPRLAAVRSATVVAMLRRVAEQEGEAYRDRIEVPAWEFPVLEICWDEPALRRNRSG